MDYSRVFNCIYYNSFSHFSSYIHSLYDFFIHILQFNSLVD